MFVDRVTLFVRGGDGGNGCLSFRREKYAPRGGPNGGDGGHGGSVVIRASDNYSNLAHLSHQRHWRAARGEHGQGSNCFGRDGDDLVIEVPPGTIVRDRDRNHVLRDLKSAGESVVVARGGRGGHGNAYFKSATNRAPRQHEPGFPGEERWIVLELKVIADVGLIGLPNAGKSTLLSRISRAHPEIADYPFTTKYPNLGTVVVDPESAFVVADIPGLIEGAHAGLGLGHEFLRHVERTSLLVHLIEAVPIDGSDPAQNYRMIRRELEQYSPALAERPELVVVTKMDLTGAELARDRIARELGHEVMAISAVTGEGIPALLQAIHERLKAQRRIEPPPSPLPGVEADVPTPVPATDARSMLRIVADLGNSRLKWARLDAEGRLTPSTALPPDDPLAWDALWDDWHQDQRQPSRWAIASVNPPVAQRLAAFLQGRQVRQAAWYQTAADVPLAMDVDGAETGGADRALAVLAALAHMPAGRPGLVVSCGTAITIERVTAAGVWQGGVIAPGLFLCARALHLLTAQLPLVHPDSTAPFWGRGTLPSLEAGIFWGSVGSIRELLARQSFEHGEKPWIVWTGGDAERLARAVSGEHARIIPDLVLNGLVRAAFRSPAEDESDVIP